LRPAAALCNSVWSGRVRPGLRNTNRSKLRERNSA
jgi:hypothetical protein